MLSDLRASADMVIDTSNLNVHQLTARVAHTSMAAMWPTPCACR